MGKYYDKLKTGNPDRKVSKQELLNVMGEFLEEQIQYLRKRRQEIFGADKPKKPQEE